jgi:sugar phosphate isomerase/epimerase
VIPAYGTNVHPYRDLAQLLGALREWSGPLRRSLALPRLGLDLRVGSELLGALGPADEERLAATLREEALEVVSLNAFPLRDFHAARVKEEVYRPTWSEPGRLEATLRAAALLDALLPAGARGTVSTSPGAFRAWGDDPAARAAQARGLALAARGLVELEERTGRRVLLCLEPEPACTLETAADAAAFFREHLEPAARALDLAPEALRRHVGVALDTCHMAVEFEDPAAALGSLAGEGIEVGKVQLSAAGGVRAPAEGPEGLAALRGLDEPRWLHQVVGCDERGARALRLDDLPALFALPAPRLRGLARLRVHFHLPLHAAAGPVLETTSEYALDVLRRTQEAGHRPDVALETYTWSVVGAAPAAARAAGTTDVREGLARELRWFVERVAG